jgi:hypothetical protein
MWSFESNKDKAPSWDGSYNLKHNNILIAKVYLNEEAITEWVYQLNNTPFDTNFMDLHITAPIISNKADEMNSDLLIQYNDMPECTPIGIEITQDTNLSEPDRLPFSHPDNPLVYYATELIEYYNSPSSLLTSFQERIDPTLKAVDDATIVIDDMVNVGSRLTLSVFLENVLRGEFNSFFGMYWS